MKTIRPILIIIVTMLLSGCAHHVGYQRYYAGYGSAYRAPGHYAYPSTSYYYQSSPMIYYDNHYISPRPYGYRDFKHHRDGDGHHHHRHKDWRKDWRSAKQHNYTPRWRPDRLPKHLHEHQRSIAQPMELHHNFSDHRKQSRHHSKPDGTRNTDHHHDN